MSGGMYCNEDLGALVVDIGSHSIRAGFAGEEFPKVYFNNVAGRVPDPEHPGKKKSIFQSEFLNVPREGVEIETCMDKGLISNWELFEEIMDHVLAKRICVDSEYHPVLFTEQAWNQSEKREKLMEIMFEKFGIPAFYLAKNPVLSCYANGRASGIVLDAGATHTTATAVMEGYAIKNAMITSPIGGNYVSQSAMQLLKSEAHPKFHLSYEIATKDELKAGQTVPTFHLKKNLPNVTQSWRSYQESRLVQDWIRNVLQVSNDEYRPEEAQMRPHEEYEFPCGTRQDYGVDRLRIPEPLFNPRMIDNKSSMLGAAHLISTSLHMCDNELRAALTSSVIITGGNSNLAGFVDRVSWELTQKTPPQLKFKLVNAQNGAMQNLERRFGSWIGGSILASLPTFSQMWISKKDYSDSGIKIVHQKCL